MSRASVQKNLTPTDVGIPVGEEREEIFQLHHPRFSLTDRNARSTVFLETTQERKTRDENFARLSRILELAWLANSIDLDEQFHLKQLAFRKPKDDHMSKIGHHLWELQRKDVASDFELQYAGHKIRVHSVVLLAYSHFFKELTENKSPPFSFSFENHPLESDALEEAISFMYSGTLKVSLDTLPHLLEVAFALEIEEMIDHLESYILTVCEEDKKFSLFCLQLCYMFPVSNFLIDAILDTCASSFARFIPKGQYRRITLDCFCALLGNPYIRISPKRKFGLAIHWLRENQDYIPHAGRIFSLISFSSMNREDLLMCVEIAKKEAEESGLNIICFLEKRILAGNWATTKRSEAPYWKALHPEDERLHRALAQEQSDERTVGRSTSYSCEREEKLFQQVDERIFDEESSDTKDEVDIEESSDSSETETLVTSGTIEIPALEKSSTFQQRKSAKLKTPETIELSNSLR